MLASRSRHTIQVAAFRGMGRSYAASPLSSTSMTMTTNSPFLITTECCPHKQELEIQYYQPSRQFSTEGPGLSSFTEPDPTLFSFSGNAIGDTEQQQQLESSSIGQPDISAQLRKDIKMMGSVLGCVIQEHNGPEVFTKIENMRGLAKKWRESQVNKTSPDQTFLELAAYAKKLTDHELFVISRSFTHFLALANTAESHHRGRNLRLTDATANMNSSKSAGAFHAKSDSCGYVIQNLLEKGHSEDKIWNALASQSTELVLTAHPTEVNRRTILDKRRRIQNILNQADDYRSAGDVISDYDKHELDKAMYREISGIWLSDEVSRFKPSPVLEAEKGTLVIETVLWQTVPGFLRKLDSTSREFLGKPLPLEAAPIKFASWMGGDRDGNPNVKPQTTAEVCLKNRITASSLFLKDLKRLWNELSLITCSQKLRLRVGHEGSREPYRVYLDQIICKMQRTHDTMRSRLDTLHASGCVIGSGSRDTEDDDAIYLDKEQLMEDLMVIYNSLCETGNDVTADGTLTDIIRNLSAFGLTLIPLDVRQESDKHEAAVDAATRFLGLGSYSQWDEDTKVNWLTTQILSKRPLLRTGIWHESPEIFSDSIIDTLETFQMIAQQGPGSLGAYVISQATSASDVLAVLLLQLDAGVRNPLRVVPLFETLDDLNGAPHTIETLFKHPIYRGHIRGKQEVMIGYSDSAKDAGRLAAVWAQFKTQKKLSKIAKDYDMDLTFFHGKGGTVGRGGNPQTFLAITSHPPDTINGKFRVTEQGEMIYQNFGFYDRAERTMDIYTAAVLTDNIIDRPSPSVECMDMMDKLSDISCEAYRKIVRHDERFVPYFRSATPELELASLNIGSRPAKRKATGGVESLRAIPWNFAWTQTRSNLPTWLGVGEALSQVLETDEAPALQKMYKEFDSFRTMIDLVEMVLAKSDLSIAAHYDQMLVNDDGSKALGQEVQSLHVQTEDAILDLTQHEKLGVNNRLLQQSLKVRNPYIDCLNILQAETLQRTRKAEEGAEGEDLNNALMTTIGGIAAGMGNTG